MESVMARSTRSIIGTDEEEALIKKASPAIANLKRTFDHWMVIAEAFEVGRDICLRHADIHPDTPRGEEGGGFSKVYSQWLGEHKELLNLVNTPKSQKLIRHYLHKCWENREAIAAWRENMSVVELSRFSFPESVFKNWAKETDFVDPDAKPKRKGKKKATEEQKETQLDYARQRIKEQIDEIGDWDHDNPEQIAEKLQQSHPAKAADVAAILNDNEDNTVRAGLDWDAPEPSLIETLMGMVPHNAKTIKVLTAVASQIRKKLKEDTSGNPPPEDIKTVVVTSNTIQ
jgi:hypothetical protein